MRRTRLLHSLNAPISENGSPLLHLVRICVCTLINSRSNRRLCYLVVGVDVLPLARRLNRLNARLPPFAGPPPGGTRPLICRSLLVHRRSAVCFWRAHGKLESVTKRCHEKSTFLRGQDTRRKWYGKVICPEQTDVRCNEICSL